MPVTAKFSVDLSQFTTAMNKAEVELKQFESDANKVKTSLERMSNAFTGRKVVQDALLMAQAIENVGGVTKLTTKELERANAVMTEAAAKMKAIGQVAPASFKAVADATKAATGSGQQFGSMLSTASGLLSTFGVGLSVGAVVGFGKALLADADALTKLSAQTGISTQWLQRFQVAGDDAGVSLESMTTGINQIQKRLIGGDQAFVGALQKLNINLAQFKALGPAEQFVAISDALRQVSDPAERTALAIATMGRAGAENLPVLVRGFDDVKDAAVGMSEDTTRALDQLGDAFGRWWRIVKTTTADVAVALANSTAIGALVQQRLELERVQTAMLNVAKAAKALPTNVQQGPIPVPDPAEIAAIDREVTAAMEANKKHLEELARSEAAAAKAIDAAWAALWDDLLKNVAKVETAVDRGAFKLLSFADAVKQIPVGAIGGVEPIIAGFNQLDTVIVKDLLHATQLGVVFDEFGRRKSLLIQAPDVSGFQKAIDKIKASLGGLNAIFQAAFEGGGGVGGAIKSFATGLGQQLLGMIPVVGGFISQFAGALVSGVSRLFSKIFGPSEAEKVNRMRDADAFLKSLGKSLGEIAEKARKAGIDIQGVLQAKTVEAYRKEVEKLKDALDFQKSALDELSAAEDEYHYTANKGAGDLLKKYELLTAAGYDQADVLSRQAEGWQALVTDSLRFGTVLPGQIKDIIQQLIDMGQITDENGNTLTDISQIRFSDVGSSGYEAFQTMKDGFDKFAAAVKLFLGKPLTDLENRLLGLANGIANFKFDPTATGYNPELDPNNPRYNPANPNNPHLTAAPGGAGLTTVHTVVNLDGRQIATVVSQHQMNATRNRRPAKAA